MEIYITIFIVVFSITFPATVYYLYKVWKYEMLLKNKAPDTYLNPGKPHLILNNTFKNTLLFLGLIKNKGYFVFGKEVNKYGVSIRIIFLLISYSILVLCLLAIMSHAEYN